MGTHARPRPAGPAEVGGLQLVPEHHLHGSGSLAAGDQPRGCVLLCQHPVTEPARVLSREHVGSPVSGPGEWSERPQGGHAQLEARRPLGEGGRVPRRGREEALGPLSTWGRRERAWACGHCQEALPTEAAQDAGSAPGGRALRGGSSHRGAAIGNCCCRGTAHVLAWQRRVAAQGPALHVQSRDSRLATAVAAASHLACVTEGPCAV